MRTAPRSLPLCLALAVLAALAASTAARAAEPFGFKSFSAALPAAAPPAAAPATQAGSHPYAMTVGFELNNNGREGLELLPEGGALRDLSVDLPPGLIVDPAAVTERCTERELEAGKFDPETREELRCPPAAAVGTVALRLQWLTEPFIVPLYEMVSPAGSPAELGFNPVIDTHLLGGLRTGAGYSLFAATDDVPGKLDPISARATLWGVPSDPSHDSERGLCARRLEKEEPKTGEGCPQATERTGRPLLRMPTACGGPLAFSAAADSWQQPGLFVDASAATEPVSGCNRLGFAPTLEARPTTNLADSPSGLQVDLHIPQEEAASSEAAPDLREAVVALPKGIAVNPASAAGLEGCTPAQLGLTSPIGATPIRTTPAPATCPDAAKLGTVEVDTPLLAEYDESGTKLRRDSHGDPVPHPLPGAVYLAQPYENPFRSLLAIYIAVHDPETGIVVKLAGKVEIGAEGQLTTTFAENPQLPFEDFKLHFFGGARAALRTPATCGTYTTTSTLTPWSAPESGPPAKPGDSYEITAEPGGGSCPTSASQQPNSPSFEAGTESPLAGAFSPFVVHLKREDGSQQFASLTVTPPPGLTGKLAGLAQCPDSVLAAAQRKSGAEEQANPSCPAASEVGIVAVAAGAGPSPFYVQGRAYLAGPYKNAPLSLAVITPALAGPFDLGTVVVRAALYVDPETAQITVRSDPIPSELKGIPLDIRSVAVRIGRPGFTLNPTDCEAMSVAGSLTSTLGQTAPLASPFQVGECGRLKFKPKLSLRLKGKTRRGGTPALRATLTMPMGGANIARAAVTLPHSEFLDNAHIRTICTRVQFAEGAGHGEHCPAGSVYGHARAFSPLLDRPLEGPVYLRSSSHKLPDLVAALNGQIFVALDGRVDSVHGGIRNVFEVVPDAPVSKFVLEMQGGRKGLLENSTNLCQGTHKATASFTAQNGKVSELEPLLRASCPQPHRHQGAQGPPGKVVCKTETQSKGNGTVIVVRCQTEDRGHRRSHR
jgi:hypothetical protein